MAFSELDGTSGYLSKYGALVPELQDQAESAADLFVTEKFGRDWPIATWHEDPPPIIERIARLIGSAEYIRLKFAKVSSGDDPPPVIGQYMKEARMLAKQANESGYIHGVDGQLIEKRGMGGGIVFPAVR